MTTATLTAPALRSLADDELLSLFRSDERAAAAALAEAARRDRSDRAGDARAAIRGEWHDAAYQDYLAAEAALCGELVNRAGVAAGVRDGFALWSGPLAIAEKYATDELREWWLTHPRLTITGYITQRAAAMHSARDEMTIPEEADDDDPVDADGRAGLDRDGAGDVRHEHGAGADESVRADRGACEAEAGPATGPIQRRGGVMGVLEGARVAEHMAVGAARAAQRLEQARRQAGMAAGAVAVRPAQTPVRPREPVDGAQLLNVAAAWLGRHVHMSDAARHACVLYVAAQHYRLPDESRRLAWPKFGRMLFTAAEPGCGKTTAMVLMGYMSAPWFRGVDSNPTARGLGHSINQEKSALFIDELHRLVGPRGVRKADVITILCSGYEKNGSTVDGRGGKANRISTYAPAVMAGKDTLLTSAAEEIGDLIDRCCAVVRMEKPPEDVELLEVTDGTEQQGELLAAKLAEWAAQQMADTGRFREAYTEACAAAREIGLRGRAKDIWSPLLATAWLAGPGHLAAACDAAMEFQLHQPAPVEEAADPLAGLEAELAGDGPIASWGTA